MLINGKTWEIFPTSLTSYQPLRVRGSLVNVYYSVTLAINTYIVVKTLKITIASQAKQWADETLWLPLASVLKISRKL